jgi:hypothetical protein
MKIVLIVLLNLIIFGFKTMSCQTNPAIKKQSGLMMELGMSSSIYLENYDDRELLRNEYVQGFSPSFLRIGYFRNRISVFTDIKYYSAYTITPSERTRQNPNIYHPGYRIRRYYRMHEIGLAYSCYSRKLRLSIEPSVSLSYRNARENKSGFLECVIPTFSYKSYGYGLGLNLRKHILKNLYVGLEVRYNYFFEPFYKDLTVESRYQLNTANTHMITPIMKLGYRIHLKKRKRIECGGG